MGRIVAENLTRTYRIARRRPGLGGAILSLARREYRQLVALDRVSFTIEPGELIGYIGPNGAGKSTTIKILSGILTPNSGTCTVAGRTPWRERREHVGQIGVVFGQRTQLWWDLPVIESFDLLRDIYRVPEDAYRASRDELIALLDLGPVLDTPVRQLSLGQRMRADLAAALLHAPPVLFLDEPTIGLDSPSKLAVRDFVRRLNTERGTTVILTTHDMDDIEALCRRVMVISRGRILCDGTMTDLRRQVTNERRLIVDLESEQTPVADPHATVLERHGRRVVLGFDPDVVPTAELIARVAAHHRVMDLFVEHPPIDDVIAALYRREGSPPVGTGGRLAEGAL